MSEGLDLDAMIERFRVRAAAVKARQIPPIEGEARKAFIDQSKQDYLDFALIGDATASLADGILTFSIDLRPKSP